MNWKTRNLARSYLHSSLWIISIGAIILELIFAALVHRFDAIHGWQIHGFGIEGARSTGDHERVELVLDRPGMQDVLLVELLDPPGV